MPARLLAFLAAWVVIAVACSSDEQAQTQPQAPEPVAETRQSPAAQQSAVAEPQEAAQETAQDESTPQTEPAETEAELDQERDDDETLLPEPAFDFDVVRRHLEQLIGELGPRSSATDEEVAAAEYLAETFRSFGYEVELQPFAFTNPVSVVRIDLPNGQQDYAFHFRGSSAEGVSAPIVRVPGYGRAEDFATVNVSGQIAVVERGVIEFRLKALNAAAAGAAALIIVNDPSQPNSGSLGAARVDIPVLMTMLPLAEYEAIETEIATLAPATPDGGESQNVIARAPGGACRVVVGGHYDTVPGVDGANDNGSGTALTLAFAELWADHPALSEICFVGFGAEELGLHGSEALVRAWQESGEFADVEAMLNLDAIGDGRAPYIVIASPALRPMAGALIDQLEISARIGVQPAFFGSDHQPFASAGTDVIFVFPPGAVLHTPADNLENLNWPLYQEVARLDHAILACLLERVGAPIAPSVSCNE